jgi:hypothetical protein
MVAKKQNVMPKLIFHNPCHAFGANNPAKIKPSIGSTP